MHGGTDAPSLEPQHGVAGVCRSHGEREEGAGWLADQGHRQASGYEQLCHGARAGEDTAQTATRGRPGRAARCCHVSASVNDAVQSHKATANQLERDCHQIREEWNQLRKQMERLQAVNKRQAEELTHANFTIDVCRDKITSLQPASQSTNSILLSTTAFSGVQPSTYQSGSFPSSMAMPDSLAAPPVLTPIRGSPTRPSDTGTPTLPWLMPQPSASRAAPPQPDREE